MDYLGAGRKKVISASSSPPQKNHEYITSFPHHGPSATLPREHACTTVDVLCCSPALGTSQGPPLPPVPTHPTGHGVLLVHLVPQLELDGRPGRRRRWGRFPLRLRNRDSLQPQTLPETERRHTDGADCSGRRDDDIPTAPAATIPSHVAPPSTPLGAQVHRENGQRAGHQARHGRETADK